MIGTFFMKSGTVKTMVTGVVPTALFYYYDGHA